MSERKSWAFGPLLLVLVVVLGAALRIWGISSGVPYAVGADEPEIMGRAVQMARSGDFNPHFFDYPGLPIYLHLVVVVVRFLQGALAHEFTSLSQIGPADFYVSGRAVTAVLGAATILLVYLIGRRWSHTLGVLAALGLAVSPLHVRESHFALTDVPLTFFVTLAFWLSLRALERRSAWTYAAAGLAAGLAAATKYNGIVVVLVPMLFAVCDRGPWPRRAGRLSACGAAAVAGFLLTAPYTVLDLPAFLEGFARLASHFRPREAELEAGWLVYLKHLRLAWGWPGTIVTAAGLLLAAVRVVRGPDRLRWAGLLLFVWVYFDLIATRHQLFARYALPLLPFLAVVTAAAVVSAAGWLRSRLPSPWASGAAAAALLLAAFGPSLWSAVQFNRNFARPTTYGEAWAWIEREVPAGATIATTLENFRLPASRYRIVNVSWLAERSVEDYRADGVDWLLTEDSVLKPGLRNPTLAARYDSLFGATERAEMFAPGPRCGGPQIIILRLRRPAGPTTERSAGSPLTP